MHHNLTAKDYIKSGTANCIQKNFDLAITDFTKAIELEPNWFQGYNSRGNAYCGQRKLILAISDHTKAIELAPYDANTHYCRGIAYYAQEQFDLAIADFTKAMGLDSNYFEKFLNLFIVSTSLKKSMLFDVIKTLPSIKQIPLLNQCLDINSELGNKFFQPEDWYEKVHGCNLKNGMLLKINEHLSGLVRHMAMWTFLQGPELIRNQSLNSDTFLFITSFFLQVDFSIVNQYQPKIENFQLTMFSQNTRKRKREDVGLNMSDMKKIQKKM
jgi:tetratricopeptide (TPR) repeat protein